MNFCKIINYDTANARGLSVVLFVSGCSHHCKECHNPETWSVDAGVPFTDEVKKELYQMAMNPHIENLVLSGGDPFFPANVATLANFLKDTLIYKEKNIICYTGYKLSELIARGDKATDRLLSYCDIIIDGEYDMTKRPEGLDYRGSTNQQAWGRKGNFYFNISRTYFKEVTQADIAAAADVVPFDRELSQYTAPACNKIEEKEKEIETIVPKGKVIIDYEKLKKLCITDCGKTGYAVLGHRYDTLKFNGTIYHHPEDAEAALKKYFDIK